LVDKKISVKMEKSNIKVMKHFIFPECE